MKKYWALIKTSLQNSLVYRVDFFLWGMNELLDTLVFLFIWIIIFGERQSIGGFSLAETITYFVGTGMISNITYSWVANDLEDDVRTGNLSSIIIKPISYPLARIMSVMAEKPIDTLVRLVVYLAVAFFFSNKIILDKDPFSLFLVFVSIVFAYLISHLISFCLGCLAFWTTSVKRGLSGLLRTFTNIFAGGYAPLTFFPLWFQRVAKFLPFGYTRYFPMLIYLRKIETAEIFLGIGVQLVWVLFLYFLGRLLWRQGVKRYEGVGI